MNKLALVTIPAVLALALGGGCKKKDTSKAGLPPASGSGAAPLPAMPGVQPGSGFEHPGSGGGSEATATASATVTGTLQARDEVSVAPRASGTIVALKVDEGSRVKKGDVLFQLDSRDAQLARRQATNQLASAQLQLKTAQREYDRFKGLVGQNAVPQQQLDQLESQVDGARLQVNGAQNAIAMADKAISDAVVRSPLTGVVTRKLLSAGEYATMMPPSPVVVVQDQSSLELKFQLPERTLSTVKQGDPVTVTIPSLGQVRAAKVSEISPAVDPRTRTVELTALLDNCDGSLRSGLAAEVTLGAPKGDVVKPSCGGTGKGGGATGQRSAP
ncbi:MAG TPA: efflux RND transporter periplasmic adaptor subunit [Kofleriaceae bacterium]|nr:efflux RND transporter periplasmic adaptor subunit [Kofleriaceae bacterium]